MPINGSDCDPLTKCQATRVGVSGTAASAPIDWPQGV
jgi:hypothetical protein